MSIFNISCIICLAILLVALLYLFGITRLTREALQGMSLQQKWKNIGKEAQIKGVSALPDTKLVNLDYLLQRYPDQYGDPEVASWINTQDDTAVINQVANQKQQDFSQWISPDTQDIDAGMANWDSTNFDRKLAYMATQQRAISAEHQEQQAATHPPADAPKKTPTPQQQQPKKKTPPSLPFGPGPVMPPFGPSPKPSPPDPGIATLLVASLSSNWVGNMKDDPEKWSKQYKSFCPPASAAACSRAIKNHCFMHGDPGCDKSHDAFWDICEHDANCVKNMWHYSLDKEQQNKIREQAKKDGKPSNFPKDLCKDTGLCNKPIKAHSSAKKSIVLPGKGGKKTPQKSSTSGKSGKSPTKQPLLKTQSRQPKRNPTKDLLGRSGGVQREYPHIKNRSLASNLAGGSNPNLNDPGVAFWNMPGPIGGGASALQYYNPQFLDDYSSVAGLGSYFQPPQEGGTIQSQPVSAAPPRQQQQQPAVIQSLTSDDQSSRGPRARRQDREQEQSAAAASTGGGGKWWHPHLFGASAPKKYITKQ